MTEKLQLTPPVINALRKPLLRHSLPAVLRVVVRKLLKDSQLPRAVVARRAGLSTDVLENFLTEEQRCMNLTTFIALTSAMGYSPSDVLYSIENILRRREQQRILAASRPGGTDNGGHRAISGGLVQRQSGGTGTKRADA